MNQIRRIADDHVTAVEIEFDPPMDWGHDDPLIAVGSARRKDEDQYDAVIGDELAYGRALIHLGRQIVKDGLDRSHKQSLAEQLRESVRIAQQRKARSAVIDTMTDEELFAAGVRLTNLDRELPSGMFCRTSDKFGACAICESLRAQVRTALRKEAGLE